MHSSPNKDEYVNTSIVYASRTDFKTLRLLGEGAYGTVYLVEREGQLFAMKEISKNLTIKVKYI